MVSSLVGAVVAEAGELRVDVVPAFDGVVRAGGWTELAVRVVSDIGGDVQVESSAGALHSGTAGRVEARVPAVFRLPVRVGSEDRLGVAVRGPGGARRRVPVSLRLLTAGEHVVARAGGALRLDAPGLVAVRTDAAGLPAAARAFELVDVLVLDVAMLGGLEGLQLEALESHLGQCGRVLLVDAPEPALRRARERAGCGGAFVEAVGNGKAVGDAVERLLARPAPVLPDPRRLAALLPGDGRPAAARPLVGFFLGYGGALALAIVTIRRAWLLLALPVAATVLMLVALGSARPGVTLGSWTEATSGAATARFAALLRIDGIAPRSVAVEVPRALGLPDPLGEDAGTTLRLTAGDFAGTRLDVRTALLSEHDLHLHGTLDWTAPLAVEIGPAGPRVENRARARSRPGYLVWRGEVFALPALDPAAAWSPPTSEPLPHAALPPVFRGWAGNGPALGREPAFVLLPGTPEPMLGIGTTAAAAGWIVIRSRQTG